MLIGSFFKELIISIIGVLVRIRGVVSDKIDVFTLSGGKEVVDVFLSEGRSGIV